MFTNNDMFHAKFHMICTTPLIYNWDAFMKTQLKID